MAMAQLHPARHPGVGTPRTPGWIATVLACLALLVVPITAWIAFPAPALPARVAGPTPVVTAPPEPPAETHRPPSRPARVTPSDETPPPVPDDRPDVPVAGAVLDAEGKAVPGASIGCTDRDPALSTVTDAAGRFELPSEAAGCMAVARERSHSPSAAVALAAGGDNTLRMERGGAIEGVVVDEQGAAVAAYMIAIESFQPAGGGESPSAVGRPHRVEDPTGAFEWKDLPAGRYILTASAEGRPPSRSDRIDVEAGLTAHRVRITLPRGATLSGTVFDADTRKPIAGASVGLDAATSTGANAIPAAVTDADGTFALSGVPPQGPFSVRVSHTDYRTKILTLTLRGSGSTPESIPLRARADGGPDSELAGIGAMLGQSPKGVIIQGLVEGGPAARVGLKSGDRFLLIDGADATAMTMSDCVQRLRGPEGTRVAVRVSRDGIATVDATILRELVVH